MNRSLLLVCFLVSLVPVFTDDRLAFPPGYPTTYLPDVFAGYLETSSPLRKLHYIFMESMKGENNTDPLTLWMNGGPGCSSKLGFIQEIGPFVLPENTPYELGDLLVPNKWSWNNLSNLLMIDNPPGVGFSINKDPNYVYNDANTAKDTLDALVYFFKTKQPNYANRTFYIAGESYAGKYIPDLAVAIMNYNRYNPDSPINLKGILVGNGVMSFEDGRLFKNEISYMVTHDFIDPELNHYFTQSCMQDEESAGCQYFYTRFDDLTEDINPYNVYGNCYPNPTLSSGNQEAPKPTQRGLLRRAANKFKKTPPRISSIKKHNMYGDGGCEYDYGVEQYFFLNDHLWNSEKHSFNICNDTIFDTYDMTETGSMDQYTYLLNYGTIKIVLFNGDWDDVVPFGDTLENLDIMGMQPQGDYVPWIVGGQHAGFIRQYSGLSFYRVKGAGHEVPSYQRERAYDLFKQFLTPVKE